MHDKDYNSSCSICKIYISWNGNVQRHPTIPFCFSNSGTTGAFTKTNGKSIRVCHLIEQVDTNKNTKTIERKSCD
jgi:hypothetical protein